MLLCYQQKDRKSVISSSGFDRRSQIWCSMCSRRRIKLRFHGDSRLKTSELMFLLLQFFWSVLLRITFICQYGFWAYQITNSDYPKESDHNDVDGPYRGCPFSFRSSQVGPYGSASIFYNLYLLFLTKVVNNELPVIVLHEKVKVWLFPFRCHCYLYRGVCGWCSNQVSFYRVYSSPTSYYWKDAVCSTDTFCCRVWGWASSESEEGR